MSYLTNPAVLARIGLTFITLLAAVSAFKAFPTQALVAAGICVDTRGPIQTRLQIEA